MVFGIASPVSDSPGAMRGLEGLGISAHTMAQVQHVGKPSRRLVRTAAQITAVPDPIAS